MSILKKAAGTAFSLIILMMFVLAMPQEASAAAEYRIDLPKTFWIGQGEEWLRLTDRDGGHADIDRITQSSEGVFSVSKDKYLDENGTPHYDVYIRPARAGRTTFTIEYTDAEGFQRVATKTFRVKKYPNEIRKLTVNGHGIKTAKKAKLPDGKKEDTRFGCSVKSRGAYASLRIKTAKGWKITSVSSELSRGADDDIRSYEKVTKKKITKKAIISGKRISFPKGWEELRVRVRMTNKNRESIYYLVTFCRD